MNDPSLPLRPDITPTQVIKNTATPRSPPGLHRHLQYICSLHLGMSVMKRTLVSNRSSMDKLTALFAVRKGGQGTLFPEQVFHHLSFPTLLLCLLMPVIISHENGTHLSPSPQCPKYIWTPANGSSNSVDTQHCLKSIFTSAC